MRDAVCAEVGEVKKDAVLSVAGLDGKQAIRADLEELRRRWKSTLGA
jgi:hypothetical protein